MYWHATRYVNQCGYNWRPHHDGSFVLDSEDSKKGLHKNGNNAKWSSHSNCPNGKTENSSMFKQWPWQAVVADAALERVEMCDQKCSVPNNYCYSEW